MSALIVVAMHGHATYSDPLVEASSSVADRLDVRAGLHLLVLPVLLLLHHYRMSLRHGLLLLLLLVCRAPDVILILCMDPCRPLPLLAAHACGAAQAAMQEGRQRRLAQG